MASVDTDDNINENFRKHCLCEVRTREYVENRLIKVAKFVSIYNRLANIHTVDFFTENYWHTIVPETIRQHLLTLGEEELAVLPSGQLSVERQSSVSDQVNQDNTMVPLISRDQDTSIAQNLDSDQACFHHDTLEEFISQARDLTLPRLNVLSSLNDLLENYQCDTETDQVHIEEFMGVKKSHEVDVMAHVSASMANKLKISQGVDIGSGRGYLGCHLAEIYKFQILGVDSSSVNTNSATSRTSKVKKYLPGLMKKNTKSKIGNSGGNNSQLTNCDKSNITQETAGNRQCVGGELTPISNGVFICRTCYITASSPLIELLDEAFNERCSRQSVMLTGLHTCGDLATSILKLYTTCPQARLLCNVGCCYNLLSEKFLQSPFSSSSVDTPGSGFPLSHCLCDIGYELGRNARMLATQSPARVAEQSKLPSRSLFWRAVLQVILCDITGQRKNDWQVGKIAAKCKTFQQYVMKAFEKLHLAEQQPTEDVIADYELQYARREKEMQAFLQLRMALAPCIEALLLLDRLCYLHEQESVEEAHLLEMFDPVTSPRCYALIAVKHQPS